MPREAPRMTMSHSDRVLRARLAAHTRWSRTPDRSAATSAARQAFADRFARLVDPEGILDPAVRAQLAENAKQAHFAKMALASARARRREAA
jgi:hypothetical protein